MNLIGFTRQFPDEARCIKYFCEEKERRGIVYPKVGTTHHYWNKTYNSHDFSKCAYKTTLRSGTVMECSHLLFHYWLYAIYLMMITKKSIAALEMQRQLEHKRYEPIWAMMHKIRITMGSQDDKYELDGVVELDDACFKTHSDIKKKITPNGAEAASNKTRSW